MRKTLFLALLLDVACSRPRAAFEETRHLADDVVGIAVDPLVLGERNEATVTVRRDDVPIEDANVTLGVSMPTMAMPESRITLTPRGRGYYIGTLPFSMSGGWLATLAIHARHQSEMRTTYKLFVRD